MRTFVATFLALLLAARPVLAQAIPTPEALYQKQKKSVALGVTLEAICPIAGVGAFYAGDSDKGTFLALLSGITGGAAVGAAFYLIHLSHENAGGVDRAINDVETGSAWTVLVVGGLIYLLARASGLSYAPDAVEAFNTNLQQRIGVPPPEPLVPFHAQVTGATLVWRF